LKGSTPGIHSTKEGLQPVAILRGRVTAVDPVRYVMSVIDENGSVFEGVQMMASHGGANGQGTFTMPEVDSSVLLCRSSLSKTPFILGFSAMPTLTSEDENEEPNDFRNNRPVLNEGDYAIFGDGGSFVVARKGGVLELGASQVARRWYLPLESAIADFCENYLLQHAGGTIQWESRTSDAAVPTEFHMEVKEFSDGEPVIDFRMGRIAEEDDTSLADGAVGAAVLRLNVNNKFRHWVDRDGNVQSSTFGTTVIAEAATQLPFSSQVDAFTATPWPHVHIEVVDPSVPNRRGATSC
jgi:hypothetical protein